MEFHHPPDAIKKVKELIAVIEPYAPHWREWTGSGASFLSPSEILILQNYLQHGTHDVSHTELKLSLPTIEFIMQLSVSRLHRNQHLFRKWLTERLLEEHGVIRYESAQYRFLHSPLGFLNIPYELKFELRLLRESCIADILNKYTEAMLSEQWFMTSGGMKQFKRILRKYKCVHLLR
ncbi:MAG: hypothetical protein K0S33_1777 [Bacteroidetes bacterium]|jgi:hypothetical protein|nr:hypothetical protein [Bacteroidota bacterium]